MSSATTPATEERSALRRRFLESLDASGGRRAGDGEGGAIRDFGARRREHEALVESAALLELTDRVLLRVAGSRARAMLDGLLTNDLASAAGASRAVYSFLLTAKGRPVADLRAIPLPRDDDAPEAFWLDLPPGAVDGVEAHFTRYLPPRFAEHRRAPRIFPLAVVGPEAGDVLAGVSSGREATELSPLETARVRVAGSEARIVRREEIEGPGFDLYVRGEALRATWDALAPAVDARGGRPAGRDAREILRVERGVPAFGAEITDEVLPQETGQQGRAISFDKGCYTGQELVVRIQHRGHVNRHLRGLALEPAGDGPPPPAGTGLHRGERRVGRLTTVVVSPRFGPVALGYVRREVEPGETLEARPGGVADEGEAGGRRADARVVELPFTAG